MDLKTVNLSLKLLIRALDELIYSPRANEDEEEDTLSHIQEACLRFVYYHSTDGEKPLAKEVAEALMISNAAVTRLLDRLEKKGYITRKPNTGDRRQMSLVLTPTGKDIIVKKEDEQEEKLGAILAQLSPKEQGSFFQGLNAFMEAALTDKEVIDRICLRCGWSHRAECPGNQIYHTLTGEDKSNV